jgi:hypothetical protein
MKRNATSAEEIYVLNRFKLCFVALGGLSDSATVFSVY